MLPDAHLLDAMMAGATRRIVYVADPSVYGASGPRSISVDEPLRPSTRGRCVRPAFDRMHELERTFARLAKRPLRVWRLPAAAARLEIGPVRARNIHANAVFSNIRLRGIGFRFTCPVLEQGLRQVVEALDV